MTESSQKAFRLGSPEGTEPEICSGGTAQICARPMGRRHSPAVLGVCPGICHPLLMARSKHKHRTRSPVPSAASTEPPPRRPPVGRKDLGDLLVRQSARRTEFGSGVDWDAALAAYDAVRPEHCRRVLTTARPWGELWHLDGLARRQRNAVLRGATRATTPTPTGSTVPPRSPRTRSHRPSRPSRCRQSKWRSRRRSESAAARVPRRRAGTCSGSGRSSSVRQSPSCGVDVVNGSTSREGWVASR
jgi:hypothetical protein